MSENLENVFGFVDDQNEELRTKSGASMSFGLNEGVKGVSIKLHPAEGSSSAYVELKLNINGSERNVRYYEPTKAFEGTTIEEQMVHTLAAITHVVRAAGVTKDRMQEAINEKKPKSFVAWNEAVLPLVHPDNFEKLSLDLFAEYQWSVGKNQTRTFLEIPRNMKGGNFLVPSVAHDGEWKEEREWKDTDGNSVKGLRYVDNNGKVHPFTRNENYMDSNKAKMQTTEDKKESQVSMNTETASDIWG